MLSSADLHTAARTGVRTLRHLHQLHAQLVHRSLHADNYWLTFLLSRCPSLRAPAAYARRLFDASPRPNPHLLTAALKFHSSLSHSSHAARDAPSSLFARALRLGVAPDAFVFPALLKAAPTTVGLVHARVVKSGCGGDRFVRNAVMDAYGKGGELDVAARMFDEMADRTAADWNSMVSTHWRRGDEVGARRVFESMPERNVVSWTAMVSGYAGRGELSMARWFFDRMPERTVVSWNAMLTAYAQNGFVEEVLALFGQMTDDEAGAGVVPDETTWVTVISTCSVKGDLKFANALVGSLEKRNIEFNCFVKTSLLDMYAKCGDLGKARCIFDGMTSRNPVSWNAMISGYARSGDVETARELFDRMPEKNVISWNSMLSGYAQNGRWEAAIELFKAMVELKGVVEPDEVTAVSVISACGHLGALEIGKWVLKHIDERRIKLTASGYNALAFMYSRCGSMEDAKRVFQGMPRRTIFSYNSLITGFAAQGRANEALELVEKMTGEGIVPDRITHIGILTACSHAGMPDEGRRAFGTIESPTVDHYACMVDLFGRAGQLDEAKKLIDGMPMEPHAGVYGSLLNASRIHKRVDLAELAACRLFELEPQNSGNYVLLANIYASLKRWEDVDAIRTMMKQRGVNKTTGCSRVEHGGQMLRYIAGDQSHELSEKINGMLESVGNKMKAHGYAANKSCVLSDVEEEGEGRDGWSP